MDINRARSVVGCHLHIDRRLRREGLVHSGTKLSVDGETFRIDFAALTGGSTVTVYGQGVIGIYNSILTSLPAGF